MSLLSLFCLLSNVLFVICFYVSYAVSTGRGVLVLYFVLSLIVLVQRFPVLYPVCVSVVFFLFHCVCDGSVMETLLPLVHFVRGLE